MSIKAKPFQQATINAAMRTLTKKKGARRFLVADEVGLGKTIVACGIIQKLMEKKKSIGNEPLSVLYVCSNQAIAKQNTERLLSFISKKERDNAIAHVDRPSLLAALPAKNRPSHPSVHIYMLTPDTAIPTRKGQTRGGRKEERALALVLLHRILPSPSKRLYRAFQLNVGADRFRELVHVYKRQDQAGELGGVDFRNSFRDALRSLLGLQVGQHLPPVLMQMLDEKRVQDLIGISRTALTIAGLKTINAGLVIFDEFQRFRDLMNGAEQDDQSESQMPELIRSRAAARVLDAIRGSGRCDGSGPALLLLSATPYTPYRKRIRHDGPRGVTADQSDDFFDLVSFLASPRAANRAQELFLQLSEEIHKGVLDSDRAQAIRTDLMSVLLPLMSRTERPSAIGTNVQTGDASCLIDADLLPSDFGQFCDMNDCFDASSRDWIVPLWQSVPLPMQTLGSRYQAWRNKAKMPDRATFSKADRDVHRLAAPWPHPRLRALMSKMSDKRMALPWAAPSLPWWPLRGGWKNSVDQSVIDGKLLVFSRFKAVPTALSGLISYTTESRLLSKPGKRNRIEYEAASKRRWLASSPDRPNLLELFHPSRLLAELEPLNSSLGSLVGMKQAVESQLRGRLEQIGVRVVADANLPRMKPWELLVALEAKAGFWMESASAWRAVVPNSEDGETVGRLGQMLEKWEMVAAQSGGITKISKDTDLPALVALALESPAVVLLRALSRHWPEAMESQNLVKIISLVWRGLRTYLDKAWFVSVLLERDGGNYPDAIRKAILEGNLESVLDEHFWFLSMDGAGGWAERLGDVEMSLRLRDVSVAFHEGGQSGELAEESSGPFTVRCHVAVPLTEARKSGANQGNPGITGIIGEEAGPLRPDEVRKAFNSPFWPNVLVTTSIGQEGLDLHPWCNSLAHWDLATSPVALEQREGRITRFGSLSVRRAIAKLLKVQLAQCDGRSPWIQLAALADDQLRDESGLSPWWVVEGGDCKKYFLTVPGGEQQERYETLTRERALYRLVLGMPDQADLMKHLDAQGKDVETLRNACLDLSAYNNRSRGK